MRAVIVGGGVIGMMQARSLALEGVSVTLIERGLCGKEASWAGGGIVSPLYPWRYDAAVTALAQWSQQFYANLAESLEAESGISPELFHHGLMVLSVDDEDDALQWGKDSRRLRQIEKDEIYQLEPELREGFSSALWMPQVSSIRNPRLVKSLRGSLARLPGVSVVEGESMEAFLQSNGRITGIQTSQNSYEADVTVVAAGAWAGELLAKLSLALPVEPVKGQMVLLQGEPGRVRRVVLRDGKYVIPRRDGMILAGSTLEHCGYDKSTTDQAREALLDMAIDLFPQLADFTLAGHWAGLRPGVAGGIPFIGAVEQYPGLFLNTGHFRNGLVLAPASVQLLTCLLTEQEPPFDAEPYRPNRLQAMREATPFPVS